LLCDAVNKPPVGEIKGGNHGVGVLTASLPSIALRLKIITVFSLHFVLLLPAPLMLYGLFRLLLFPRCYSATVSQIQEIEK